MAFPVHAGVIPHLVQECRRLLCVPRSRGVIPWMVPLGVMSMGVPRSRGGDSFGHCESVIAMLRSPFTRG